MTATTDFSGRKAIILGGSRGIGAAIVRRFAGDGAEVIFTYAGSAEAAAALAAETGARALQVDSADRDAVIAMIAAEAPIDILVTNAAIAVTGDPLRLDADKIDRMIDVNLRGAYFASVEAARKMPEGGRIVIIGSSGGDRVPFPGTAAYAMTKAGLQGIVRGLARDFGPRGITVNVIQPGPVDTDMNPADSPGAGFMHRFMAVDRHIRADEVAAYTAFIASPDAAMITGSMQTIDGGFGA